MPVIAQQLQGVHQRIAAAAREAGREPESIQLLAVSKGQNLQSMRAAYQAGARRFGESYLQEALSKQEALADLTDIEWHFLGPAQSNKTRALAAHFHWLHSLDRLKIAQRLSEQRPSTLPPLNVCLQVNIDAEPSKSGVSPDTLEPLARAVDAMPGLRLRGLMAIPARSASAAHTHSAFGALRQTLIELRSLGLKGPLDTLSMGMSGDLEAAVAEGATCVRIGTDIFGPRIAAQPS